MRIITQKARTPCYICVNLIFNQVKVQLGEKERCTSQCFRWSRFSEPEKLEQTFTWYFILSGVSEKVRDRGVVGTSYSSG